jgi:hypothetical protein
MVAVVLTRNTYSALATSVLAVHALFILWVIFGAFLGAVPTDASLAACCLADLGNSYGTSPLAMSVD